MLGTARGGSKKDGTGSEVKKRQDTYRTPTGGTIT